ncbi:hypothetical protein FACS189431_7260 [Alphaproteobacteria bacterium]|nr:hypothetical protein FACS189431_7260 [Alphaproteobacteria bacterium]
MAQAKKKNTRKARNRKVAPKKDVVKVTTFKKGVSDGFARSKGRIHNYKTRRPHRSFRRTRRRDYKRSLKMP